MEEKPRRCDFLFLLYLHVRYNPTIATSNDAKGMAIPSASVVELLLLDDPVELPSPPVEPGELITLEDEGMGFRLVRLGPLISQPAIVMS